MNLRCIHCAGKGVCGRSVCPIQQKINSQTKINQTFKKDFFGASPNIFVGRFGYPDVNVGMLSNENITKEYDNPGLWSKDNYQIPKLIDLRSSLINSRFKANVKSFDEKFLELTQEVSQSAKPVDVEINLNKKPKFNLTFNQDATPYGPSVKLEKAEITENPKIPRAIDKVVSEDDFKAVDAMKYLYKKGFDEHYLTKLISVGNLGLKENRKLVPSRWSITCVDSTLSKQVINEIQSYKEYDYISHFGSYLGNYYLILFIPEIWNYELFETMANSGEFATDFEGYNGRKKYAQETAGGYYATRIGIAEYLKKKKRQASVLCLRFITEEYWAPLGVWVVRESVRITLESKPFRFSSLDLMLKYAQALIKKKFNLNLSNILQKSIILKNIKQQSKLTKFL